jgi:hypothetical protein
VQNGLLSSKRATIKPQPTNQQTTVTANQLLRKMNILTPYKKEDVIAGIALISRELFGPAFYEEPDCISWTQECYKLTPDTEDNNFGIRCDFIAYGTSGDVQNLVILARKSPTYLIEEALEQLLKIRLTNYAMYLDTESRQIGGLSWECGFDSSEWNAEVWNDFIGFEKGAPDYYKTWDEVLNVYKDGTLTELGEKAIEESLKNP